ncbi:MAG: hypothetical protein GX491_10870 [Chloroflexi bacterium]|nr:hypothetical protein [Chloroflexota bacterium]
MISQKLPSFWSFFGISIVLSIIGWGGLAYIIFETLPTLGPRWLFFFLLTLALSGTSLPVMYFLNRRFPSDPPVGGNVVVREAMWVGVYGSLLVWLQLGRVLTYGLAMALLAGLILIEFLLRLSERSAWSPGKLSLDDNEPDDETTDPLDAELEEEDDA